VTHDGRPLYTFVNDTQAGEANGNGAGDGAWSIVSLAGFSVTASTTCEVSPVNQTANLRQSPSVNSNTVRSVNQGDVLVIAGQAFSEGYIWWQLATGEWVRDDVVALLSDCSAMPTIEGVSVPAPVVQPPAATQDPNAPVSTPEVGS
jgi:hypothetical protein